MMKSKTTMELEKLVNFHSNGGGFGDPDALKEHERQIDLLKHKQILEVKKSNNHIAIINVIIAIVNVIILVYQTH